MKTLVCHPDNLEKLRKEVEPELPKGLTFPSCPLFNVRTDPYMERDKPTGRYVLPSGEAVEKDQIRIRHRFITYGPEDLSWLLYAGLIKEERELLFFLIDDLAFRVSMPQPAFDFRIAYYGFS